jgi:hypothetical protein
VQVVLRYHCWRPLSAIWRCYDLKEGCRGGGSRDLVGSLGTVQVVLRYHFFHVSPSSLRLDNDDPASICQPSVTNMEEMVTQHNLHGKPPSAQVSWRLQPLLEAIVRNSSMCRLAVFAWIMMILRAFASQVSPGAPG